MQQCVLLCNNFKTNLHIVYKDEIYHSDFINFANFSKLEDKIGITCIFCDNYDTFMKIENKMGGQI